jgi:hypothetical protein
VGIGTPEHPWIIGFSGGKNFYRGLISISAEILQISVKDNRAGK